MKVKKDTKSNIIQEEMEKNQWIKKKCVLFRNRVFIYYHGRDCHEIEEPPHGNRKNNKQRPHHRTIKSEIEAMKVNPNKPGVAYKKLVTEDVPNDLQKVTYPKNMKQIENVQYNERSSKGPDKDEFDVFYELFTELKDYVKK